MMNKSVFLESLRRELSSLPADEVEEILYDYEEHLNIGLEKGKSEEDIIKALGDPGKLGKSYRAISVIEEVNNNPTPSNIYKALLSVLSLGFFNIVFIVGPYIGLLGVLLAFFASAVAMIIAGLATVITPLVNNIMPIIIVADKIPSIAVILIGVGVTSLGILFFIFDIFIGKKIYFGTVKYLNWNLDIIKKGMVKG